MAETTRHRAAFDVYWSMGAERSIERLRAAMRASGGHAPSLRTLYDWSSRFRWQDRILRLEREARRVEDEARIQRIREMYERHAKEALLLQQKGAQWLATFDDDRATTDAAIRAIVEGARLERLARGEPTERQEVHGDVQVNERVQALSDEELDRLLDIVSGTVGREGTP